MQRWIKAGAASLQWRHYSASSTRSSSLSALFRSCDDSCPELSYTDSSCNNSTERKQRRQHQERRRHERKRRRQQEQRR